MPNHNVLDEIGFVSSNSRMSFLNGRNFAVERDILNISSALFNIETLVRRGVSVPEIVTIDVSEELGSYANLDTLSSHLQDLIDLVVLNDIQLNFRVKDTNKHKRIKEFSLPECENLVLFSGGVDSISGILTARNHYGNVRGVFVGHGDQPRGIGICNILQEAIQRIRGIPIHSMIAPSIERFGYSQMRGFLYCMYGSIILKIQNGTRLVISECGPTMYQPGFSPIDQITMTTHPLVLEKTKRIIELLLDRPIEMVIPFEDLTKSEVIKISPEPQLMERSHSCISSALGDHDGTCYGCVIRKLSFLTAGVNDTDNYRINPFTADSANKDSLLALLRFCSDILIDYENLLETSKLNIDRYGKYDLYKRFSEDIYMGLYKMKRDGARLHPSVNEMYEYTVSQYGEVPLIDRMRRVRTRPITPNFDKIVM